ncbi:hypothetical protein VTK26DRAFT_2326 [Humicola hyalothermophila]
MPRVLDAEGRCRSWDLLRGMDRPVQVCESLTTVTDYYFWSVRLTRTTSSPLVYLVDRTNAVSQAPRPVWTAARQRLHVLESGLR